MPSQQQDLYRDIWKPKLERERAGEPYEGGNLRIDTALDIILPGERLLDVGCGSGTLGSVLLGEAKYREVYGLELSEEAAARSRERGLNAVAFDLNGDRFPYEDSFFDAVTCLAVMEHVLDPRVLLDEIARVLKPGGTLLVDTPNIRYMKHLWTLLAGRRFPVTTGSEEDLRLAYDGGHLHYFTVKDVASLLRARGLEPRQSICVLPPRLRRGPVGAVAEIFSRVPGLGELMSAEIFLVARKQT